MNGRDRGAAMRNHTKGPTEPREAGRHIEERVK